MNWNFLMEILLKLGGSTGKPVDLSSFAAKKIRTYFQCNGKNTCIFQKAFRFFLSWSFNL